MLKLSAYKFNYKLFEPLSISFHTFHYIENVLIFLYYKNIIGSGEAAPFELITGDNQNDVIENAKKVRNIPLDPLRDDLNALHDYLDEHIKSQTLRAAIDFAYHDLIGKIKHVPLYKLYSKNLKAVDNSLTVFVKDSLEETARETLRLYKKEPPIRILKIKLKGTNDVERVRIIKNISPPSMKYTLDANQGFINPREAVGVLDKIGKILGEVILVEEPCPQGELEKLKYVTDNIKRMMVFADESAATFNDVKKIIVSKAANGVNIKLQKAGGIWPAKQIAKLCADNKIKIMVGCMLEGPISLAAGTHFAVSTPNVTLTDFDGDYDMPKHTNGRSIRKQGKRFPPNKNGLGVTINKKTVESLNKIGQLVFRQVV